MKAISPMLATILILAITVGVGMIIFQFGSRLFQTTSGVTEEKYSNFTGNCAAGMVEISSVKCSSTTDGLVGYWKFEEGSGSTAKDSSGNGNTGTLTNMNNTGNNLNVSTPSGWAKGRFGNGMGFDGANDYVNVGNSNSLSITNAVTIEAWVYFPSLTQQTYTFIVSKKDPQSGPTRQGYILGFGNDAKIVLCEVWKDGSSVGLNPVISQPGWYHLVCDYDGNSLTAYVNGAFDSSASAPNALGSNTAPVVIGTRTDFSPLGCFYGTIDEVRIYNRGLTAAEVAEHYQYGASLRMLISNTGRSNLGREFNIFWTANNTQNNGLAVANSEMSPGSAQWINVTNITESGLLTGVKVSSKYCPNIFVVKDYLTGQTC